MAFVNNKSIAVVTIPIGLAFIGNHAFAGCTDLRSINIPAGVMSIGNYVFASCESLTSITIPAGVTSIGSNAFSGCRGLTSVTFATGSTINDWNWSNQEGFGDYAFPEGEWNTGNKLKTAYLAAGGGAGTYKRAANGDVWTKQP